MMIVKNSINEINIKPKIDVVWYAKEVLKRKGEIVVGNDGRRIEIEKAFLIYLLKQDERLVEFVGIGVEDVSKLKSQLNFVVLNMDYQVKCLGKIISIVEAFLIYLSVENRIFLYDQKNFDFDEFLQKNNELGLTTFHLETGQFELLETKNPYKNNLEVETSFGQKTLIANNKKSLMRNFEKMNFNGQNGFIEKQDLDEYEDFFCDGDLVENGRKSLILNKVNLNVGNLEVNYLMDNDRVFGRASTWIFGLGFIGMGIILLIAVRNEFLNRYFEVLQSNNKSIVKNDRSLEKEMENYRYNSGFWFMNLAKEEQMILSDFNEIVEIQNNLNIPFRSFKVSKRVNDSFNDYAFNKGLKFDDVKFEDEFKKKKGFIGLIPVDRKRQVGKIFEFEKIELMLLDNNAGESKGVLIKSLNENQVKKILKHCHENDANGCVVCDEENFNFRMSEMNWRKTQVNAFLIYDCDKKNIVNLSWELNFKIEGNKQSYFAIPRCSEGECLDEVGSFVIKDGDASSELAEKLGKKVCELNEKIKG